MSEIEEHIPLAVDVGKEMIALILSGDKVYAISNVCTHQFALMSEGYVEEGVIECPLHQGRFEIASGKALGGPVCENLKTYALKVEDGAIFVALA